MRNLNIQIQNRINAGIEIVRNSGVAMDDVVRTVLSSLSLRFREDWHAEHLMFAHAYPGSQASRPAMGDKAKLKFRPTSPTFDLASWCTSVVTFLTGMNRQRWCPAVSSVVSRIG